MKIDFTGDPEMVKAVREGVRDALLDPRFGRELLLDLCGRFVWVTLEEAAEIVGHDARTIRRWAAKARVDWSRSFGDRQKRYRLGSVQEARPRTAVAARQPRAKAPVPAAVAVAVETAMPAAVAPVAPDSGGTSTAKNGRPHPRPPEASAPLRGVRMLAKQD